MHNRVKPCISGLMVAISYHYLGHGWDQRQCCWPALICYYDLKGLAYNLRSGGGGTVLTLK